MLFERNFVIIVNSINYRSVLLFFFENEQVISLLFITNYLRRLFLEGNKNNMILS